MVQNIIDIGDREDRVINIVKAKFGLKTKSQAIALITEAYEESFLEPELRPKYIKKAHKIMKQKAIKIGSFDKFVKRYEKE